MNTRVPAKIVLCTLLILQLALPNPSFAAPAAEPRHNVLLGHVLDELGARYERIMTRIPPKMLSDIETQRRIQLETAFQSKKELLQEGILTPSEMREEALKINLESLKQEKAEIAHQVRNLPSETLDRLAGAMRDNVTYNDSRLEYEAAFTQQEKAGALISAIFLDLDHHFSMMNKRSVYMTKEGWVKDFDKTRALYSTKSYGSRRWLRVLGVAALGVAAVGLLSWGYASTVYKGKYNDRKSELDGQFEALRQKLENQYNELSQRLTSQEESYLQQNGYVWMTCGTYELPDSILCNRYSYGLFQGTKYCSVECYRNPSTGREAWHTAPNCVSPFVPNDCYDPDEYYDGQENGYNDGYNDGYDQGWNSGDKDGANEGYEDGYENGYDEGYNLGYDAGFIDGYNSYFAPQSLGLLNLSNQKNYQRGYDSGYRDAGTLFNHSQN